MSFKKFLITEAEKKISAKQFTTLCKTLDTQYGAIQKILDDEAIKMSGNPNVSGMLNKLQGAIQKAAELCVKVVETIEERQAAEKLVFPQAKKMTDAIGTGIKKAKK